MNARLGYNFTDQSLIIAQRYISEPTMYRYVQNRGTGADFAGSLQAFNCQTLTNPLPLSSLVDWVTTYFYHPESETEVSINYCTRVIEPTLKQASRGQ